MTHHIIEMNTILMEEGGGSPSYGTIKEKTTKNKEKTTQEIWLLRAKITAALIFIGIILFKIYYE